MRISISNIGWPHSDDNSMLESIARWGVDAIEIAPSRLYDDFRQKRSDWRVYRKKVDSCGLTICSMHSLFWKIDGCVFGTESDRRMLDCYMRDLVEMANSMEVPKLVLGSPSVRKKGALSFDEAIDRFTSFIFPISEYAYSRGTKILIEPLGIDETDFVNTHTDGIKLCKAVNSRGFGLHLDAKAICLQSDSIDSIIMESAEMVEHFHVNEMRLGSFSNPQLPHELIADALKRVHYRGYVSIEMKTLKDYVAECETAVKIVKKIYGDKKNEM